MEQPIAVFEPIRSGNYSAVVISVIIAGIALVFLIFNKKKEGFIRQKGYQQMFSLLTFFVIIIATATAFFSFWAAQKLTPVKIFANSIETAFGKVDFEDIHKIYIHDDQQRSRLSGVPEGAIIRLLIIEESDRKTHVLSEENYNIDSLLNVLNSLKK